MRMKKLLILAVAAIALVACSRTFDTARPSQAQIGFNTWAEHLTKARVAGTNAFANGDDFAVYGYKDRTDPASTVTVFDDVVVSTTDGTIWNYTPAAPARYWDSNYDKYVFYAISPAAIGTGAPTFNAQTGAIVTDNIVFAGNNNDVLVASEKTVNKTDTPVNFGNGTNAYGTVGLVFNHVASMVDVFIKKAPGLSTATVTVSSFAIKNILSAGVLSVSAYTPAPTVAIANWGPVDTDSDSADDTADYTPELGAVPVYGANGTSAITSSNVFTVADTDTTFPGSDADYEPAAATQIVNSLIVMPQEFGTTGVAASQKIEITYKIAVTGGGENEYTSTLYLADFDTVDNEDQSDSKVSTWAPGKHYAFYLTIDAKKIDFSASITPWGDVISGYHYLVN